jgi:hypothetical protein
MAGAANCAKIRLTARKQWFGQEDAGLQTISFNGRVSEKLVQELLFNDKMDIILKRGEIYLCLSSYVSRDEIDLNQLSFGISGGLIQSQLDETSFLQSGDFDPLLMEL